MQSFAQTGNLDLTALYEVPPYDDPQWYNVRLWGRKTAGGTYLASIRVNGLTLPDEPLNIPTSAANQNVASQKSRDLLLQPGDLLQLVVFTVSGSPATWEVKAAASRLSEDI